MSKNGFRGDSKFLILVAILVLAMIAVDAIGLGLRLYSQGAFEIERLLEQLVLLMLLEGSLVGVAGAFLSFFFGKPKDTRKGELNPATAKEQQQALKEKRLSIKRWALAMLVAGVLLIVIGFLTSIIAQV